MKPLISIIVPVYKVEAFLDRCVTSIVNQSYDNLEIILVDDGSPDNCPSICDAWAEKDSRITVLHQDNKGLSAARNAGLDICSGEYIAFVDSDDWVDRDMYSTLLEFAFKYNTPLVICGRNDVYEDNKLLQKGRCPDAEQKLSAEQVLPFMLIGKQCDSAAWDKLYHRDLWTDIHFPEGKIYEDIAIMYKIVIDAREVAMCPMRLYNYFHRANSIVTSKFSISITDYSNHTRQILYDISALYPEYREYAIWTHIRGGLSCVISKLLSSDRDLFRKYMGLYKLYVKELKSYRKIWRRSHIFNRKDKFVLELLTHRKLARILLLIRKYKNIIRRRLQNKV